MDGGKGGCFILPTNLCEHAIFSLCNLFIIFSLHLCYQIFYLFFYLVTVAYQLITNTWNLTQESVLLWIHAVIDILKIYHLILNRIGTI